MADFNTIANFLNTLFVPENGGGGSRTIIVVAGGMTEDGNYATPYREQRFSYPNRANDAVAWLIAADGEGLNAFVGAFATGTPKHRGGRPCLSIPDAPIVPTDPAPSLVLDVGGGRYQLHWRLAVPVDGTTAERLFLNLRLASGRGYGRVGAADLVRPPSTTNTGAEGSPTVTVVSSHPERLYTPNDPSGRLVAV